MFRSRTNYPKTQFSNIGSCIQPIFIKAYDDNGEPFLEKHGEKNIYDVIQAHYDDTSIKSIVARFEAGDNSVLSKVQGFYADLTHTAATLQDAMNANIKLQAFYQRMPADVKAKFPDIASFVKSLGTDELKDMILPKAIKADSPDGKRTVKEDNSDAIQE